MKCLVTGATGFLGTNVVHELVRAGHTVRAFGLPGSATKYIRDVCDDIIFGDVTSPGDVDKAVRGTEAVIHVAGDTSFWKRNFERQRKINVEGPANVAGACLKHGVKRLVHTGTIDALGYNPNGLTDETWSRYNYAGMGYNYGDTKREGEKRVLSFCAKGLDVVVIYPGSMLGPYDFTLQFGRLFFDLRDGKVPALPCGGIGFGHVTEVARAHVSALTKGLPGEGYICAGVNATYRELCGLIAAKFGKQALRWDMPGWMFTAYGYVMEFLSAFTGKPPEMNPGQARFMSVKAYYDSQKAVKELGYTILPLQKMVDDAFDWYAGEGLL
jgi:dihydroflavonol-4-reductase